MKNISFSIDAILEKMPLVRTAVRDDIANRMSDGEDICHSRNGDLMVNDRVIKSLDAAAGANAKWVGRRAA